VAERLRAARPDLPVLFMSGYAREALDGRSLLDGRTSFLPKPFTPDQLLEKVRDTLNG
jgi:CheY-like chemotaxis protein